VFEKENERKNVREREEEILDKKCPIKCGGKGSKTEIKNNKHCKTVFVYYMRKNNTTITIVEVCFGQ